MVTVGVLTADHSAGSGGVGRVTIGPTVFVAGYGSCAAGVEGVRDTVENAVAPGESGRKKT